MTAAQRVNIARAVAWGFDRSEAAEGGYIRVRCSQCAALVVNGVACHETGCPNAPRVVSEPAAVYDSVALAFWLNVPAAPLGGDLSPYRVLIDYPVSVRGAPRYFVDVLAPDAVEARARVDGCLARPFTVRAVLVWRLGTWELVP